jgi:hypothetical protein
MSGWNRLPRHPRTPWILAVLLCLGAAGGPDGEGARRPAGTGPAVAGNLPFFYDLYTFRGTAGRTAVVAAFAVEAGELKAEKAERGIRYRFDVTLVLADTALRTVSRTDDSVYVALPRRLGDEHLLYTQIEVLAAPSRHTVQRVVMSEATIPGVGQLYHSPFPIPDYSGSDLMLSDVALGRPTAGAGWRRDDIALALLPTTQFPASSFDVYYEVYNLPHGNRYTTEIRVAPIGATRAEWAGEDDPVGLRFSGEAVAARDGSVRELRRVDAALDRGQYRLTVTVTDQETGESASRSRDFHVRGWDRGATLVPAYPWRTRVAQ